MNWMIMLVLFTAHHRVSTCIDLYLETEHLRGSCFPHDSCAPTRPENQDHLWANYTCECGAHCIRYGTCCANSPHVGEVLFVEYRGESCQRLSTAFSQPVIAVSTCSPRWRCSCQIRDKCEKPADIAEDPMSVVHVTSLATRVTYKNYFCAMCNHDSRDVHMWDVELRFEAKQSVPGLSNVTKDYLLENIFYDDESRAWGIVADDGAFYEVKFKFKVPAPVRKYVKKCYPNMVSRCDRSFSGSRKLQYKCTSYYAPIKLQEADMPRPTKYRNVHCAVCNGVNITQPDYNICKLDAEIRRQLFSLAHLLDINTSDGEMVGKKQICDETQKWDPFFKKCRSLSCAIPGYVVKDGRCVQN